MPTKHGVNEGSKRFKIDPESRNITNRLASKTVLVQGDINSERLVFELPRFIAGHDMTLCDKIEVHYINIKEDKTEQSEDVYPVKDIAAIPDSKDLASFSWLVSGNATKYMGVLGFLIRFACMKDDELVYAWHTNIYENVEVGKGMNNGEAVKAKYSDILEAWKAEITSKLRAEMGGDINALREQLDTAKVEAVTYTDEAKAEAIAHADKLNAEMNKRVENLEAVTLTKIDDTAVAYEKAVPEGVAPRALLKSIGGASKASKNVFNPNKIYTEAADCWVNPDGTISTHLSEDSMALTAYLTIKPEAVSVGKYFYLIEGLDEGDAVWVNDRGEGQSIEMEVYLPWDEEAGRYPPEGRDVTLRIMLYQDMSVATDTVIFEPAPEGTVFEPYWKGFKHAKVTAVESLCVGDNLFNPKDIECIKDISVNEDGSFSVTGTWIDLVYYLPAGTYHFVCEANDIPLFTLDGNTWLKSGDNFTLSNPTQISIGFGEYEKPTTITAKIAIFEGTEDREFEPYLKSIGSLEIPEVVQARDGYGKAYNAIEFEGDKVNERVTGQERVLNGSESWEHYRYLDYGTLPYFYLNIGNSGDVVNSQIINDGGYPVRAISTGNTNIGIHITNSSTGYARILIRPADYASLTLAEFKARLAAKPVTVIYAKSSPTVNDITHLFPKGFDELKVVPGGALRFVNAEKMPVPSTITYVKRKE